MIKIKFLKLKIIIYQKFRIAFLLLNNKNEESLFTIIWKLSRTRSSWKRIHVVCIFCKQERGRAPIYTAPEVSHNKRVTSVGETIRWVGLPLLVVHLASVPSLSALRYFLFGFLLASVADHTANVSARTQARCFIRSGRLICVRNNLTPELRVPARVATSPLAISTGTRLIVMTIVIETTLKCGSAFRISRITILDPLTTYYK